MSRKDMTFAEMFHEHDLNKYSVSADNSHPKTLSGHSVRVHFNVTEEMVGCHLAMSERHTGARSKTCDLYLNRKHVSHMRVGAGHCFRNNLIITEDMVGQGYFDYTQVHGNTRPFREGLEIVCMPRRVHRRVHR
jgi:hypothetical protein